MAAIAYNDYGEVVGVSKWEAEKVLQPNDKLFFEITIISLGPPIDRVETFEKARL